jgi:hypothetical protein
MLPVGPGPVLATTRTDGPAMKRGHSLARPRTIAASPDQRDRWFTEIGVSYPEPEKAPARPV